MLMDKLATVLREECGLQLGDKLMVGVSGGPDSLVLVDILARLGYSIFVAHFNHQLRSEAPADAEFVKEVANSYGLAFIYGTGDTPSFAHSHKLTIEEAARKLRYQFLFEQAEQYACHAVVVGHTADDQVETVLMHLLRGSGLDGLVGLQSRTKTEWSDHIPLVRPMLGIWRKEILNYCDESSLQPRFDKSNLDTTYFRNRLRNHLLPILEDYNPKFKDLLWKTSETLSADREVLDELVDEFLKKSILEVSDDHLAIDLATFDAISLGLKRRILRQSISLLRPGLRDIGFGAIEHALQIISNPPETRRADLVSGLYIVIEEDRFIVSDWGSDTFREEWPQLLTESEISLTAPGEVNLANHWKIKFEVFDRSEQILEKVFKNDDLFIAYFDLAKTGNQFTLRTRWAGDRFSPLGMQNNSVKLSDFMVNIKLPSRARKHWPLVVCRNQIAWVPGYRISHQVRVKDASKSVVRAHLSRDQSANSLF